MNKRHAQAGITLVMSLIMMVVLTLLVVSAVRFGNINLKIAGNAQTEAETAAATQVALEKMIEQVNLTPNIANIPAQPSESVPTGGTTYTVSVAKPTCTFSKNIVYTELDPTKAADKACFEGADPGEVIFDKDGLPIPKPTACKNQNWDVKATLQPDGASGAQVSMLQGVSVRVGMQVQCP